MKNVYALAIAGTLGALGLLCNFAYLKMKTGDVTKIEFIGIAPHDSAGRERRIAPGQKLRDEDLVPVGIPAESVGDLEQFAYLYSGRKGVLDQAPWRELRGGRLLLRSDMDTPPERPELADDEVMLFVPVDMRRFVPALAMPGNLVSFTVSQAIAPVPTPAPTPAIGEQAGNPSEPFETASNDAAAAVAEGVDLIGPFRVVSLGNRLGSAKVWRGARAPQVQENVLTVAAKMIGGKLEPKAEKLVAILESSGYRGVGVILHPLPSGGTQAGGTP